MNDSDAPPKTHRYRIIRAEDEIQRVLFALEEATGWSVEWVEVDTRNFANLKTEITLTRTRRQ